MRKKVPGSRRVGKEVRLLEREVAFVGVDVHKRSFSVAVWTEARGEVAAWSQPSNASLLCRRLEPVRAQVGRVVYEAGPTGYGLCRALRAAGFAADVIAPSLTPRAPGPAAKCDRKDCRELAFLAGKGMLRPVAVPTPEEEADRQLVRRRDQAVGWRRRVKHQIKSFLLQHGIAEPAGLRYWSQAGVRALRGLRLLPGLRLALDSLLDELASATEQYKRLTRQVRDLADTERHAARVALLRRVPGVGLVTAMTFATELPHPEHFPSSPKLTAYLGLAPSVRQSGQTEHRGPLMKAGNRRVRTVLIEAAWQWRRYDPAAQARYRHLLANTKKANKAIVGVARHLGILLWRIATTGALYSPAPGESPTDS